VAAQPELVLLHPLPTRPTSPCRGVSKPWGAGHSAPAAVASISQPLSSTSRRRARPAGSAPLSVMASPQVAKRWGRERGPGHGAREDPGAFRCGKAQGNQGAPQAERWEGADVAEQQVLIRREAHIELVGLKRGRRKPCLTGSSRRPQKQGQADDQSRWLWRCQPKIVVSLGPWFFRPQAFERKGAVAEQARLNQRCPGHGSGNLIRTWRRSSRSAVVALQGRRPGLTRSKNVLRRPRSEGECGPVRAERCPLLVVGPRHIRAQHVCSRASRPAAIVTHQADVWVSRSNRSFVALAP